jgi:hypothetical protein
MFVMSLWGPACLANHGGEERKKQWSKNLDKYLENKIEGTCALCPEELQIRQKFWGSQPQCTQEQRVDTAMQG